MRSKRLSSRCLAAAVLVGVWIAATAPLAAMTVSSDLYPENRFPEYRTFAWVEGKKARHPDVEADLRAQVEGWLSEKGLVGVVDPDEADLTVATHADRDNLFGIGMLRISIVDTETKKIAWAGQATDVASNDPKKVAKKVRKALKQMFRHFPVARTEGSR